MEHIKGYERFVELLGTRKALIKQREDDSISVKENKELANQKDAVEKEIDAIASTIYRAYIQFVKDREDLVSYSLAKHWFYKVGYSGFHKRLKSKCGSMIIKTYSDNGEGFVDCGETIIIPRDFIFDPVNYEKRRKAFMLGKRQRGLESYIKEKQQEVATLEGRLKLTRDTLGDLMTQNPHLNDEKLDYIPL
ncbi:hypothetical protein [Vibrio crassostreae]|uniref:hypothetical protein n=1 Tax=Vibrio crassostreae TaxID=246167 RepID=UPI001B309138|nr:hypothetical protein [Vibrio crassostreae]